MLRVADAAQPGPARAAWLTHPHLRLPAPCSRPACRRYKTSSGCNTCFGGEKTLGPQCNTTSTITCTAFACYCAPAYKNDPFAQCTPLAPNRPAVSRRRRCRRPGGLPGRAACLARCLPGAARRCAPRAAPCPLTPPVAHPPACLPARRAAARTQLGSAGRGGQEEVKGEGMEPCNRRQPSQRGGAGRLGWLSTRGGAPAPGSIPTRQGQLPPPRSTASSPPITRPRHSFLPLCVGPSVWRCLVCVSRTSATHGGASFLLQLPTHLVTLSVRLSHGRSRQSVAELRRRQATPCPPPSPQFVMPRLSASKLLSCI